MSGVTKLSLGDIDDLWSKVRRLGPDECWPWSSYCDSRGYGAFRLNGRKIGAHRAVWMAVSGAIPQDLCVCHRCDNPPCCNPAHLFLGTYSDNMRDMVAKGRQRGPDNIGEKNGRSILTEDGVAAMRLLRASGLSFTEIGRRYGVNKTTARHAIVGICWKHIRANSSEAP